MSIKCGNVCRTFQLADTSLMLMRIAPDRPLIFHELLELSTLPIKEAPDRGLLQARWYRTNVKYFCQDRKYKVTVLLEAASKIGDM